MKAKEGVIERLNGVLGTEMLALTQYFLHAELCKNWGYERLYEKFRETSMEEMRDAEALVRQILYLEGRPNLQKEMVQASEAVQDLLQFDLDLERGSIEKLTEAIAHCQSVGDYNTRNFFEEMIRGENSHVDWLETQIELIRQIGLDNYLTQQVK